jgi:hypothetical protein
MVNAPEVTRAHMDDTRAALSEKLETLEQRIVDTVHGAADAVVHTVDNVKDVVHDTVGSVKDTFDVPLQVDRHPWAMVGGAVALGFAGGYILYRSGAAQPAPAERPKISERHNGAVQDARPVHEALPPPPENAHGGAEAGCGTGANQPFGAEIAKLKRLAIGTLLSIVRDMITQSAPEPMQAGLTEVIDGVTVQLGGEPIRGPVLKTAKTADNCSA